MADLLDQLQHALRGRYTIERELGRGGMATVYLAHDVRHGRRVAIKVLHPELAAVIGADRFLVEITTTANLQHPHILGLIDSGEVDGIPYYVMPFVDGESLRDRLTREKQLPIDDALLLAREIADALAHAHRRSDAEVRHGRSTVQWLVRRQHAVDGLRRLAGREAVSHDPQRSTGRADRCYDRLDGAVEAWIGRKYTMTNTSHAEQKGHGRSIMSRFLIRLVLLLAVVSPRGSAQTLTITNATVVDVSSGQLRRGTTVVIDGNRIMSVGPSSATTRPRGRVVDATGMYVIPGLWDMHTHSYFGWSRDFGDTYVLPLFIANGITGIRDMGSDLDAVLRARSEVAAHRLVGPRMVVSGPMLDGPKVAFAASIAITTTADGRQAVDMLKAKGVDFIKVQSGVPRDAYFAIADEAKKQGIEFEGHVPDAIRASEAVAAGQRTFEHLIGIFEASTPDEDAFLTRRYGAGKDPSANKSLAAMLDRYDAAREASIIQLLAKNAVWQCPTLFWERGQWLVDVIDYTRDPDIAYTPRTWIDKKFPSARKSIVESMDTDPLEVRRRFVDHELDIVHKLHVAGVPFLAGTDTPAGVDVTPGISLHLELQRFVAAGFTPLEALQTATINPARFLGKLSDYGSVQTGRIADLVLLRANPLDDIANTRAIGGVVADGRYWSHADITALRERLTKVAAAR